MSNGWGGGIRQTEIQAAVPFVPEPSISEVEVAIGKLKSPGADQIPADWGKHYILRSTNLLSCFGTNKNFPPV
jgi:hypothetical protein